MANKKPFFDHSAGIWRNPDGTPVHPGDVPPVIEDQQRASSASRASLDDVAGEARPGELMLIGDNPTPYIFNEPPPDAFEALGKIFIDRPRPEGKLPVIPHIGCSYLPASVERAQEPDMSFQEHLDEQRLVRVQKLTSALQDAAVIYVPRRLPLDGRILADDADPSDAADVLAYSLQAMATVPESEDMPRIPPAFVVKDTRAAQANLRELNPALDIMTKMIEEQARTLVETRERLVRYVVKMTTGLTFEEAKPRLLRVVVPGPETEESLFLDPVLNDAGKVVNAGVWLVMSRVGLPSLQEVHDTTTFNVRLEYTTILPHIPEEILRGTQTF